MNGKTKFYFNEGLDGIVIARSLKHAISILRHNGYGSFTKQEILKGIKTEKEVNGCPWFVEKYYTNAKKSKMVGWIE